MVRPMNWRRLGSRILPFLAVLGLLFWQYSDPGCSVDGGSTGRGGSYEVEAAFEARHSGQWLEASGRVVRLLADDNKGARHQRFILGLGNGGTLLVVHNIDLARRLPLTLDDRVVLRGRYEWNEHGGVVHWTHHDPNGRLQGGWILHKGTRYH
jgi:hypothetical protein